MPGTLREDRRIARQYNSANQQTRMLLADGSWWEYRYDALGQVISGKRYWADGTPVAGQQFEYSFDDIGNRKSTAVGGDKDGAGLRAATYSANRLNQYSSRTVPGYVDILGDCQSECRSYCQWQQCVSEGRILPLCSERAQQLSAARLQPNGRGQILALVTSMVLCRAALNGATSSPTAEIRLESVVEQFDAKSLEGACNWGLLRRFSTIQ